MLDSVKLFSHCLCSSAINIHIFLEFTLFCPEDRGISYSEMLMFIYKITAPHSENHNLEFISFVKCEHIDKTVAINKKRFRRVPSSGI
jgi:hypothetical protein